MIFRRGVRLAALVTAGAAALAGAFLVLSPTSRDPVPVGKVGSLDAEVDEFTAALDEDAPYRRPGAVERETLIRALRGPERSSGDLAALGMTTRTGVDDRTGRRFALVNSEPNDERGWGMYVVDLSAPTRVVVQVPHPNADLITEDLGLAVFRELPGAVLAIAGTHRRVADGEGDVAHRDSSMFHAVAEDYARRGLPQLQLHGYEDDSLPGVDIVLSPGASEPHPALPALAERLDDEFRVCEAWRESCGQLEGRLNRQGVAAAEHGSTFVHIEINRTVRDDPDAWSEVVVALASAAFSAE